MLEENEELYRLLSDASFEAIAVHDNGRILAVNTTLADLFGYGTKEFLGMDSIELAAPESRDVVRQNIGSRQEEVFRAIGLRKDGSRFPAEVRGKAVRYRGRSLRVVAIRDLTEHIRSEKAVQELKERLTKLIEGLPLAVFMVDTNGRPRYGNRLSGELAGMSVKGLRLDVRTERFSEALSLFKAGTDQPYPRDSSPAVRALGGEVSTADDIEIRREGASIPLEVSSAPIYDEQGEIAYAVVVFRDITLRRQVEQALQEAEEKYRNIFENSITGIFQSTPSGKFLTVNPAMARIWGYESPEEMTKEIDNVANRYVRRTMRYELQRLIEEQGVVQGFEAQMVRKDGSIMWTRVSARAVRGEVGKILYYEGSVEDVTERKLADKRIADSEVRYRTLVETSPDAISLIDIDLKVATANRQAADMFGYASAEEMVGVSVLQIIAPVHYSLAFEEVVSATRTRKGVSAEYNLLRRDGTRFPAEISVASVPGSEGRPAGFIAIVRDITRRKEDEEALRRINAELDGYARTVSHDLRNPLAAIVLASETLEALLKKPETAETRGYINEMVETTKDSAQRATDLIEDLLVLAEVGQELGETEDVDVAEVVRTVLVETATEIAERDVPVRLKGDLGHVNANPTHVYQVFSNLLGNAVMHNDNEHPVVEVSRLADDRSGGHRFRVRDNGSGIPDTVIGTVFMPFSKGANGHTGIGLTIVEKIVKAYNGEVKAYNDDGAVFEVTFRDI